MNELATSESGSVLSLSQSGFDHIQRVARMFSESQLVPPLFQKNIPNVVIALEIAQRIGASPLMVVQNLNVIHGKPSFGSSFMIASVNACGRFTPLRFIYVGKEGTDEWGCYAVATAKVDNAECRGVTITMAMAKAEGWVNKSGSKWKTMPQLMMSYRAATWWTRMFAPELLMGFPTADEAIDVDAHAEPAPTEEQPKRGSRRKGIAEMKAAEPVGEPGSLTNPAPATAPAQQSHSESSSSSEEQPATPAEAAPASVPEKTPEQLSPAPVPEPNTPAPSELSSETQVPDEGPAEMLPRCEIKKVEDKGKGVFGVTLDGDYTGTVFYQWAEGKPKIPDAGAIIDVRLEDKPSKVNPARTLKCIASFEVVS